MLDSWFRNHGNVLFSCHVAASVSAGLVMSAVKVQRFELTTPMLLVSCRRYVLSHPISLSPNLLRVDQQLCFVVQNLRPMSNRKPLMTAATARLDKPYMSAASAVLVKSSLFDSRA